MLDVMFLPFVLICFFGFWFFVGVRVDGVNVSDAAPPLPRKYVVTRRAEGYRLSAKSWVYPTTHCKRNGYGWSSDADDAENFDSMELAIAAIPTPDASGEVVHSQPAHGLIRRFGRWLAER